MENQTKIALLIDADNASAKSIEYILSEVGKYGKLTVKRIYGDFTSSSLNSWKDQLNRYAIRPIQKFAYTKGKNSSDSSLIIDAMDLLYSKTLDGFCIVSSDSDYTGIAHRIREEGLFIMGVGKQTTPEAFVKACENFVYEEILFPTNEQEKSIKSQGGIAKEAKKDANVLTVDIRLFDKAFDMAYNESTDMALANVLSMSIKRIDASFDTRNYGFNTFRKYLEEIIKISNGKYEKGIALDGSTIFIKKK